MSYKSLSGKCSDHQRVSDFPQPADALTHAPASTDNRILEMTRLEIAKMRHRPTNKLSLKPYVLVHPKRVPSASSSLKLVRRYDRGEVQPELGPWLYQNPCVCTLA